MPKFDDERPGTGDKKGGRDRGGRPAPDSDAAVDAPPTEEELRAAAGLRKALGDGGSESPPATSEGRWLAAHLRRPTAEDSLGEVRAWRLARAAREGVQARRARQAQRSGGWVRLGRSLTSTGGLLAAAALLLVVSWVIVGQGPNRGPIGAGPGAAGGPEGRRSIAAGGDGLGGGHWPAASARAVQGFLFRRSLKLHESPAERLDLMIKARLAELRSGSSDAEHALSGRALAAGAVSMGHGVVP